jgi:RNA polymerase sigma-70 factor (ECF subfamily)
MRGGTESLSDVELLERIAGRDRLAFRTFYDRHAPRTHGVVRHLCGSDEAAEDLLQDVFLLVWRKAASFRAERGDVGGWLYTICRNRATDSFRRADKSCQFDTGEVLTLPAQPAPVEDEVRMTLRKMLGALAPDQREAVDLAYFGGLTYAETAQQLNVPLGTLKSRVRAALACLREQLET